MVPPSVWRLLELRGGLSGTLGPLPPLQILEGRAMLGSSPGVRRAAKMTPEGHYDG